MVDLLVSPAWVVSVEGLIFGGYDVVLGPIGFERTPMLSHGPIYIGNVSYENTA